MKNLDTTVLRDGLLKALELDPENVVTRIRLGESHFELLRAFADEPMLNRITAAAIDRGYRAHEFGDSMLIERPCPKG